MYKQERMNEILELLKKEGSLSVAFLAEHFQVTGATVRTDLTEMEKKGLVQRTHGGVMLAAARYTPEPGMEERKNGEKKAAISRKAVEMISDGETILIDTGSTTAAFAQAIAESDRKGLTVYSSDLDVLRILESKPDYQLYMMGGKIRNGFHYANGSEMIAALEGLRFSKSFMAASAISFDFGLSTADAALAVLKRAMIASSSQVILLADSSKIGLINLHKFADLNDIDMLIMDDAVSENDKRILSNRIKKAVFIPE